MKKYSGKIKIEKKRWKAWRKFRILANKKIYEDSGEDRNIKIIELASQGMTQRKISTIVGISQPHVSRIISASRIEIKNISHLRILEKFKGINIELLAVWFDMEDSIKGVVSKCLATGLKVNSDNVKYVLKEVMNIKVFCRVCNKETSLSSKCYCSAECKKMYKLDRWRTQQLNSRIKNGGKILSEVIFKDKKIKEARGICYLCGEKLNIRIVDKIHPLFVVYEHIISLAKSNDGSTKNIRVACRCCNELKRIGNSSQYTVEDYQNNKRIKVKNYIPKESIDENQFKTDFYSGMKDKELAEKYNRSASAISSLKKKLGIYKQDKLHVILNPQYATQEVARLTQEGKSLLDIQEILGIAGSTISKYRKKAVSEGLLEKNRKTK